MALTLRRNISWNVVGRGVYAASQWVMLLVLARMGGPDAVGRFALALAVTAPIVLLSNLALRHVQATDAAGTYDYGDYVAVRSWTTFAALVVIAAVVIAADYPWETAQVIGLVGLAKAFESMSDIVYGLEQVHHRLDLTARSMMLRGFAGVAAMAVAYWLGGGLVSAVAAMTAAWGAAYLLLDRASERTLLTAHRTTEESGPPTQPRAVPPLTRRLQLVRLALPMGVVVLLVSLNMNIPRYFIEAWFGEAALGTFAAMAYFAVVGSFVVNGLGQAALVDLSTAYAGGRRRGFYGLLGRIVAVSLALGVAGVAVSVLFGRELLALLYGPAFARDAELFVWVMTAGALNYAASSLVYGVTARRIFTEQAVLSAVVLATNAGACALLIGRHGMLGAVWGWIASIMVQIVLTALLISPRRPGVGEATSTLSLRPKDPIT